MKHLRTTVVLALSFFFVGSASPSEGDYQIGPGSFSKEMWINKKAVFKKPVGVNVEFVTPGAFEFVFADPNGKEVRTVPAKNEHGGWTSMNFSSLGLFGDYSIGFRNASPGEKEVKGGEVHLK